MASRNLYLSTSRVASFPSLSRPYALRASVLQFQFRCISNLAPHKHVSGIWYIPSPTTTDPSSIIPKLPRLTNDDRRNLARALILVTPGVARWFESDSTFHQDVINRIYSPVVASKPPTSYVAVVDSLPSPEYFNEWNVERERPYSPAEGIAICLLSDIISRPRITQKTQHPAVLRVVSHLVNSVGKRQAGLVEEKGRISSSLTIPFANTLFLNGSAHTVHKTAWKATENRESLVPKYNELYPLEFVQFMLPKTPITLFDYNVPLHALTVRRKVISSMGNVIREIEGDNGQPIRASAELEAVVPKFLAQHNADGTETQMQVFARAMPPDVPDASRTLTNSGKQQPAAAAQNEESFQLINHKGMHRALWHGGRMHRVTSGGGGWGKKAGLLSLNPATNFEPPSNMESGMFPDPDAAEVDTKVDTELGALIPTGHTIQFFAAKILPPYPSDFKIQSESSTAESSTASYTPEKWSSIDHQKILLGVTTANEAPQSETPTNDARSAPITVLPGCFGALSEGGASVRIQKHIPIDPTKERLGRGDFRFEVINEFRIDTPFATFASQATKASPGRGEDLKRGGQKSTSKGTSTPKASSPLIKAKKSSNGLKIRKITVDTSPPSSKSGTPGSEVSDVIIRKHVTYDQESTPAIKKKDLSSPMQTK